KPPDVIFEEEVKKCQIDRCAEVVRSVNGSKRHQVSIFGDVLAEQSQKELHKAFFDNATHAVVGGLSWLIVCVNQRSRSSFYTLLEVVVCTCIASLIDVDHFIVAKSFNLKNATNLDKRPFLHCSSIPIVLTAYLLLLSYYFKDQNLQRAAFVISTAFFSHHTRDATRRGYWFYPFGHTAPIPYFIYLILTIFIPYLTYEVIKVMNLGKSNDFLIVDV
ncbi:transmembrane protein 267, partial [Onthophagus taurus]|uniref:transmembrane protein 267 n=1 Tax=Onthophagus taurus TaxID=166361 RepID=UPI0039BE91C0